VYRMELPSAIRETILAVASTWPCIHKGDSTATEKKVYVASD
jgi:hypothetical protein